jgi:hypothetical protein
MRLSTLINVLQEQLSANGDTEVIIRSVYSGPIAPGDTGTIATIQAEPLSDDNTIKPEGERPTVYIEVA